jgi:serine/threonine protein kinase
MPSHFAIDGLPIPRPRSPRIFAPRTDLDVEDGIPDITDGGVEPDGSDNVDHDFGKRSLLRPTLGVRRAACSTMPLYDSYDTSPNVTFDGLPVEMTVSPAAMFLSAFSPPAVHMPIEEEATNPSVDGYTLGPVIGHGGFSTVHRATSPSGDVVAVKVVRTSDIPDELSRQRLANEATVWASLSHEHILPLFRASQTPTTDYFFMPLCPAGTLFDILRRDGRPGLPHDDAGMMFRQVVRGVRYLHEQAELVHGDLKLENVLVDASGSCRIADFGMACPISHEAVPVRRQRSLLLASRRGHAIPTPAAGLRAHHHSGTRHRGSSPLPSSSLTAATQAVYELPSGSLPYAAPELLRVPSPDHPYIPDPAQDVWALGVMLHGLLTGRLLFSDSFEPRLVMKILKGAQHRPRFVAEHIDHARRLRGCRHARGHRPRRRARAARLPRVRGSASLDDRGCRRDCVGRRLGCGRPRRRRHRAHDRRVARTVPGVCIRRGFPRARTCARGDIRGRGRVRAVCAAVRPVIR